MPSHLDDFKCKVNALRHNQGSVKNPQVYKKKSCSFCLIYIYTADNV